MLGELYGESPKGTGEEGAENDILSPFPCFPGVDCKGRISRKMATLFDSIAKSKGVSPNKFFASEFALLSTSNWAMRL